MADLGKRRALIARTIEQVEAAKWGSSTLDQAVWAALGYAPPRDWWETPELTSNLKATVRALPAGLSYCLSWCAETRRAIAVVRRGPLGGGADLAGGSPAAATPALALCCAWLHYELAALVEAEP